MRLFYFKQWVKDDPKILLRLFITGSLAALLICLCVTAIVFSAAYVHKEEERAKIFTTQINQFFEYQNRTMSEEMWTHNYESIISRVAEIGRQLGDVRFSVALADEKGSCVATTEEIAQNGCHLPKSLVRMIERSPKAVDRFLKFDESINRYVYMAPLYVGPTRKGSIYATISDPYEFYRGHSAGYVFHIFLPAAVAVVLLWVFWLLISHYLILKPYLSSLVELEKAEALGKFASDTAHDIRSPLSALDVVLGDMRQISEEKRAVVRSALRRITDIANHLLEMKRTLAERASLPTLLRSPAPSEPIFDKETATLELISSPLDLIVSEKRYQYRPKMGIHIETRVDAASYGLFSKIQLLAFKRAVSNLIDNAVEALGEKGNVTVSLSSGGGNDNEVLLTIEDTGKGIPEDILKVLLTKEISYGKSKGSGSGLMNANKSVVSWGGKLEIQSELGRGTRVMMKLPRTKPADWFVEALLLTRNSSVVILDDDPSIHQVWRSRFESYELKERAIPVYHFSTPDELMDWHAARNGEIERTTFLVDYELIDQVVSGLDLIEGLSIEKQSILVTSRFDEEKLRDRCVKGGVRLIPKGMAGFVPIRLKEESGNGLSEAAKAQ